MNNFIISLDNLRDDLIIVTEYHQEYNEQEDIFKIFVPGGKMLEEKFKIDSYYDFMLYTHVEQAEDGEVQAYKFVTKRWKQYNARFAGLYEETLIDNNLDKVLKDVRNYLGL